MKRSIIAFSIIVFTAACHSANQPPATAAAAPAKTAETETPVIQLTEAQFSHAAITTALPEIKPVNRLIKVNGVVETPPDHRHTISFPLGGYLKTNSLIPGMYVKKGSLLATMEDAAFIQLQQDYLLSKSKLGFLEADYKRQQELNKTQSSSDRTVQQARADYESQLITRSALAEKLHLIGINTETLTESNLSRTVNIYAPISGYISKVNVNPGKYVSPTDVLFEIIDPSHTHITLTVFENDAALMKPGQKVICTSNASGDRKMPATIHLVAPDLDENRAVEVHCDFDQPTPGLLPGAFINAEILLPHQPGITLPNDALVKWQNAYYVFIETGTRRYKMTKVEAGISTNGFTQIVTALPEGAKVVTANAYALLSMIKNTGEEE